MDAIQKERKLAEGAEEALASFEIDVVEASDEIIDQPLERRRLPRGVVPGILLLATLISMTWAGIAAWSPAYLLGKTFEDQSLFEVRRHVLANWLPGVIFSISLAIILGAHELGHYFATKIYRIQSSLPIFIPFPFSPIGTCGAVILMDGLRANRKQIFDIGLAGPLAGLVFAVPIAVIGLLYGTPPKTREVSLQFGQPIVVQWLAQAVEAAKPRSDATPTSAAPFGKDNSISNQAMNPMLMAAWVGFLITGLNMIPISQLDGGHVIFGLLGRSSRSVAWITYLSCIGYVAYTGWMYGQMLFLLMLILIPLMGIEHPPSSNDDVEIGTTRQIIGLLSLAIPILCIPFRPIIFS
jgi:membrane-associated protease RseP (regulator of RpoE activity)